MPAVQGRLSNNLTSNNLIVKSIVLILFLIERLTPLGCRERMFRAHPLIWFRHDMSEDQNLVLNHLQHIRGTVDSIDGRLGGFEGRVSAIERDLLDLAKSEAGRNLDAEAMAKRMKRLEERVAKLENERRVSRDSE